MSPAYFFDNMTFEECAAFLRGMQRKEQDEWERTRMLMYCICQVNSTKELIPSDILAFPWDEVQEVEIDENEIKELRERAKMIQV